MPDLPADFLARARQVLLPLVENEEERDALLTDAFYLLPDSRLYHQINQAGSAMSFTTLCIKTLIKYECLSSGTHALGHLLMTCKLYCGINKHAEIDDLAQTANALCAQTPPSVPAPPPVAVTPLPTPIQTVSTPRTERQATVFISYSHRDTDFANRLIAALNAVGHACWIDSSEIKGGDEWIMTIAEGINNSYAFVPVVTRKALESRWVQDEILWARQKNKLIIPVLLEDVFAETRFFPLVSYQGVTLFGKDESEAIEQLKSYLPAPTLPAVETAELKIPQVSAAAAPRVNARALELDYLERLRLEELLNTEKYTDLGGVSQHNRPEMRTVFELLPMSRERDTIQEPHRFENAINEIRHLKQAVLLGEPGGGKTTTLWKLAAELVAEALNDPKAPIPLLIRLGKWTDENQPLEGFIASQISGLGEYLDGLLTEKRAALLLDGLNELPVSQRESKYPQVQRVIKQHRDLLAVVSCRELDYTLDLGFAKITITPLDPLRIREFVTRYLGADKGTDLFWRLAGQKAQTYHIDFMRKVGAAYEREFWLANSLPAGVIWTYDWDTEKKYTYWDGWLKTREHPSSLMMLARNPYMLLMLTSLYAEQGTLPANRGQVFSQFVATLLRREQIALVEQENLIQRLSRVAYTMQSQKTGDKGAALTVLPQNDVKGLLGERGLYLAGSSSILSIGEQVRFTHQLLQEYFAARYMDLERLNAEDLWPIVGWWKRTNWEEAALLLAGLYSDDPTPIVLWLKDAQPEIAAQCITRSGAALPPDATLMTLRESWLPRLTDAKHDPEARARGDWSGVGAVEFVGWGTAG